MAKGNKSSVGNKKLVVRQVRSAIGRDKKFKATLCALGLGRIGSQVELVDNPAVNGMLAVVDCVVDRVQA